MKTIQLHIHEVKQYIKENKDLAGKAGENLLYLLSRLEETCLQSPADISDRMLDKKKFIDAIMATYFSRQSGDGQAPVKMIREQLERAYDTGKLAGMDLERRHVYEVAVILEGGTFSETWSDRPGITVHKIDVDDQGSDPVIYSKEEAEFTTMFNINEILKSLESKFE